MALPNPYLAKPRNPDLDLEARRRMTVMPSTAPSKPKGPRLPGLSRPAPVKAPVAGPGAGGKVSPPSGGGTIGILNPDGSTKPGVGRGGGGSFDGSGNFVRGTPAPATSDNIDQMIRDRVAGELGAGKPDTAAQEALIRQQQDAAIGSGAVNARARAGRGGFESSGAIMGIEGDIERQARAAATEQTLGVQDRARQEQFDRQQSVIDSELALRDSASNDFINQRLLDLLAMDEPAAAAAPAATANAAESLTGTGAGAEQTTLRPAAAGSNETIPQIVTEIPAGSRQTSTPGVYVTPGGVFVKRG